MQLATSFSITWKGKEKTVPAQNMLKLLAINEQNYKPQLIAETCGIPLASAAQFYSPLLRSVGFDDVEPEQLFAEFIENPSAADEALDNMFKLFMMSKPPKKEEKKLETPNTPPSSENLSEGETDEKKPDIIA